MNNVLNPFDFKFALKFIDASSANNENVYGLSATGDTGMLIAGILLVIVALSMFAIYWARKKRFIAFSASYAGRNFRHVSIDNYKPKFQPLLLAASAVLIAISCVMLASFTHTNAMAAEGQLATPVIKVPVNEDGSIGATSINLKNTKSSALKVEHASSEVNGEAYGEAAFQNSNIHLMGLGGDVYNNIPDGSIYVTNNAYDRIEVGDVAKFDINVNNVDPQTAKSYLGQVVYVNAITFEDAVVPYPEYAENMIYNGWFQQGVPTDEHRYTLVEGEIDDEEETEEPALSVSRAKDVKVDDEGKLDKYLTRVQLNPGFVWEDYSTDKFYDAYWSILPAKLTVHTYSGDKIYDTEELNPGGYVEGLQKTYRGQGVSEELIEVQEYVDLITSTATHVYESKVNKGVLDWDKKTPIDPTKYAYAKQTNYVIEEDFGNLEISPADLTVIAKDQNYDYDSEPHGEEVVVKTIEEKKKLDPPKLFYYYEDEPDSWIYGTKTISNVVESGEVHYKVKSLDYYDYDGTYSLSLNPRVAQLKWGSWGGILEPDTYSKEYDNQAEEITCEITNLTDKDKGQIMPKIDVYNNGKKTSEIINAAEYDSLVTGFEGDKDLVKNYVLPDNCANEYIIDKRSLANVEVKVELDGNGAEGTNKEWYLFSSSYITPKLKKLTDDFGKGDAERIEIDLSQFIFDVSQQAEVGAYDSQLSAKDNSNYCDSINIPWYIYTDEIVYYTPDDNGIKTCFDSVGTEINNGGIVTAGDFLTVQMGELLDTTNGFTLKVECKNSAEVVTDTKYYDVMNSETKEIKFLVPLAAKIYLSVDQFVKLDFNDVSEYDDGEVDNKRIYSHVQYKTTNTNWSEFYLQGPTPSTKDLYVPAQTMLTRLGEDPTILEMKHPDGNTYYFKAEIAELAYKRLYQFSGWEKAGYNAGGSGVMPINYKLDEREKYTLNWNGTYIEKVTNEIDGSEVVSGYQVLWEDTLRVQAKEFETVNGYTLRIHKDSEPDATNDKLIESKEVAVNFDMPKYNTTISIEPYVKVEFEDTNTYEETVHSGILAANTYDQSWKVYYDQDSTVTHEIETLYVPYGTKIEKYQSSDPDAANTLVIKGGQHGVDKDFYFYPCIKSDNQKLASLYKFKTWKIDSAHYLVGAAIGFEFEKVETKKLDWDPNGYIKSVSVKLSDGFLAEINPNDDVSVESDIVVRYNQGKDDKLAKNGYTLYFNDYENHNVSITSFEHFYETFTFAMSGTKGNVVDPNNYYLDIKPYINLMFTDITVPLVEWYKDLYRHPTVKYSTDDGKTWTEISSRLGVYVPSGSKIVRKSDDDKILVLEKFRGVQNSYLVTVTTNDPVYDFEKWNEEQYIIDEVQDEITYNLESTKPISQLHIRRHVEDLPLYFHSIVEYLDKDPESGYDLNIDAEADYNYYVFEEDSFQVTIDNEQLQEYKNGYSLYVNKRNPGNEYPLTFESKTLTVDFSLLNTPQSHDNSDNIYDLYIKPYKKMEFKQLIDEDDKDPVESKIYYATTQTAPAHWTDEYDGDQYPIYVAQDVAFTKDTVASKDKECYVYHSANNRSIDATTTNLWFCIQPLNSTYVNSIESVNDDNFSVNNNTVPVKYYIHQIPVMYFSWDNASIKSGAISSVGWSKDTFSTSPAKIPLDENISITVEEDSDNQFLTEKHGYSIQVTSGSQNDEELYFEGVNNKITIERGKIKKDSKLDLLPYVEFDINESVSIPNLDIVRNVEYSTSSEQPQSWQKYENNLYVAQNVVFEKVEVEGEKELIIHTNQNRSYDANTSKNLWFRVYVDKPEYIDSINWKDYDTSDIKTQPDQDKPGNFSLYFKVVETNTVTVSWGRLFEGIGIVKEVKYNDYIFTESPAVIPYDGITATDLTVTVAEDSSVTTYEEILKTGYSLAVEIDSDDITPYEPEFITLEQKYSDTIEVKITENCGLVIRPYRKLSFVDSSTQQEIGDSPEILYGPSSGSEFISVKDKPLFLPHVTFLNFDNDLKGYVYDNRIDGKKYLIKLKDKASTISKFSKTDDTIPVFYDTENIGSPLPISVDVEYNTLVKASSHEEYSTGFQIFDETGQSKIGSLEDGVYVSPGSNIIVKSSEVPELSINSIATYTGDDVQYPALSNVSNYAFSDGKSEKITVGIHTLYVRSSYFGADSKCNVQVKLSDHLQQFSDDVYLTADGEEKTIGNEGVDLTIDNINGNLPICRYTQEDGDSTRTSISVGCDPNSLTTWQVASKKGASYYLTLSDTTLNSGTDYCIFDNKSTLTFVITDSKPSEFMTNNDNQSLDVPQENPQGNEFIQIPPAGKIESYDNNVFFESSSNSFEL